jgi:anti-sigma regulatory factor (Ser/Thr protein kinase)
MSIVGRDVYLRVTDREKAVAKPVGDADWESEPALASSLGLTLMQGLMDEVALHETDEGTTVRLVKRLRLPANATLPSTDDAPPPTFLETRQAV